MWGCQGCIGGCRECRYLGARRGISSIRGHWVSPRRCRGCWEQLRGVRRSGDIRGYRGCQGCIGGWQGV